MWVCVSVDVCICAYLYVHLGCMDGLQMNVIYVLYMPVFIRELQHHSVLLTALACNWLTELNVTV